MLHSLPRWKGQSALWNLFYKGTKAEPPRLHCLPKAPPLNSIPLGIRSQHRNVKETPAFSPHQGSFQNECALDNVRLQILPSLSPGCWGWLRTLCLIMVFSFIPSPLELFTEPSRGEGLVVKPCPLSVNISHVQGNSKEVRFSISLHGRLPFLAAVNLSA